MAKANHISVAFGKAVKQERLNKGMTQDELAEKSLMDRSYISQIERGIRNPMLQVAWVLASNLEMSLLSLVATTLQLVPEATHKEDAIDE